MHMFHVKDKLAVDRMVANARAGHFTLPEEVLSAHRAPQNIRRARGQIDLHHSVAHATSKIVDTARRGDDVTPIVDEIREAVADDEARRTASRALNEAIEEANDYAVQAVVAESTSIINDRLKPALEETLRAAKECAEQLVDHLPEPDPLELLSLGDETRQAWVRAQDLAERYNAILDAQRVLHTIGVLPKLDETNEFGSFTNFAEVVQQHRRLDSGHTSEPPWPSDPAARLLWIVGSDLEPWVPTPDEQDEAYARRREQSPRGVLGMAGAY